MKEKNKTKQFLSLLSIEEEYDKIEYSIQKKCYSILNGIRKFNKEELDIIEEKRSEYSIEEHVFGDDASVLVSSRIDYQCLLDDFHIMYNIIIFFSEFSKMYEDNPCIIDAYEYVCDQLYLAFEMDPESFQLISSKGGE